MSITVFDVEKDLVINSYFCNAKTDYEYALDNLYGNISKFSFQRKLQDIKFYSRLKEDLLKKCLMPPITIAFIDPSHTKFDSIESAAKFINDNIENCFILDGIQRLNTLKDASQSTDLDLSQALYINVIIAPSNDNLIYRMITLNNGQKPMSVMHQIEILTRGTIDFDTLGLEIELQTEKQRGERIKRGSFKVGDISRAHAAFLTNNVHVENSKIIAEKMDELISERILEAQSEECVVKFNDVLQQVSRLSEVAEIKTWFQVPNNLIGFSVGGRKSLNEIKAIEPQDFLNSIRLFDEAFKSINLSKVNLGKFRRQLVRLYISKINELSMSSPTELTGVFSDETAN